MDIALSTFLNASGLSAVGQEYFKCFESFGLRVVPVWLFEPDSLDSLNPDLVQRMTSQAGLAMEAPLQFHTGLANDVRPLKDRHAIAASIVVEGNRLSDAQANVCRLLDIVFNPSYFCRNVCVSSGISKSKIHYLPYPLDSAIWNPTVEATKSERFRFLYMNSCYERKGWDILLRAYWEEFTANDNVELVLKSYRENDRPEHLNILVAMEASKLGVNRNRHAPPISIIDNVMSAGELPIFMKSFDAYVSPHRSEGFGMNIWHAMALGIPVVCTNYGGCTDFAKDDTAWMVKPSKMVRPGRQEIDLFGQYADIFWAEPDIEDLKRQMRACYINRSESSARAALGAKIVSEMYSYKNVMDHFQEAVRRRLPGVWEELGASIEVLARQSMPRFESVDKPLRMVEI